MTVAIVDDEPLARERIRTLLQGEPDVTVVAECANGAEAIDSIRTKSPSLVFLDVQMPVLDGFDVLFALKREELPAAIIFVTAYDRYAVRAFEVNAIDYLMKPYTKDRFAVTLERARTRLASPPSESRDGFEVLLRSLASRAAAPERIAVRLKDSVQFVRTSDIDWLQADGNYTKLHVGASAIRTRETLSELETKLSPAGFVRIHRSIVLNVDRIVRLEPWTHGEYVIVLRNGTKLNSSRAYGEELRRLLD